MSKRILVIGDGAWGQALAHVAKQVGNEVAVWSRRSPSTRLDADAAILAVPAQVVREVLTAIKISSPVIISAAKGIERDTGLSIADVVNSILPNVEFYALSGPSFAIDVSAGLPTAVTLAGPDLPRAAQWAKVLTLPHFRIYASDDVKGVEIGGALKNVLAIACGVADGCGLGESARASLITRGFAELSRYGAKLGAKPETLMGLSGLGDLLLTSGSAKSRNHAFGLAVGKGVSVAAALEQSRGVVEGAYTASIAAKLAKQHDVDMPIIAAVAAVIDGHSNPRDEIAKLLARPVGVEFKQG